VLFRSPQNPKTPNCIKRDVYNHDKEKPYQGILSPVIKSPSLEAKPSQIGTTLENKPF
jgi:hypothetical protein